MPGGFKELENITADLGLEAWGSDIEEAITSTAQGLISLLTLPSTSKQHLSRSIRIEAESLQGLLVGFLNEIIYLEDAEDFIPGRITSLRVGGNSLQATLYGEHFDPQVHVLNAHIKAATYHGLEIVQKEDIVRIKVIFDV